MSGLGVWSAGPAGLIFTGGVTAVTCTGNITLITGIVGPIEHVGLVFTFQPPLILNTKYIQIKCKKCNA